jgi:hypothetical protein
VFGPVYYSCKSIVQLAVPGYISFCDSISTGFDRTLSILDFIFKNTGTKFGPKNSKSHFIFDSIRFDSNIQLTVYPTAVILECPFCIKAAWSGGAGQVPFRMKFAKPCSSLGMYMSKNRALPTVLPMFCMKHSCTTVDLANMELGTL